MRRTEYLIKHTLFALATVFVAITINFFLFRVLPGDAERRLIARVLVVDGGHTVSTL